MTNKNEKIIPKCDFPTLLKDCLNNMNMDKKTNTYEQIKNNLVSGFKATGIVPFNPDSVLRRLPDYNDNHSNEVADNLIEFLKEQRFSSSTQMIRRKNKCLHIEPGVSVTANDSEDEGTEEAIEEVTEEAAEEETEEAAEEATIDNTDSIAIISEVIRNQLEYKSINAGNYLLVQVQSSRAKGTVYRYVVLVRKKIGKDKLLVNGLMSMDSHHSTFKFVENDVIDVLFDDVILLLPEPKAITIRGRTKYQFSNSVNTKEA